MTARLSNLELSALQKRLAAAEARATSAEARASAAEAGRLEAREELAQVQKAHHGEPGSKNGQMSLIYYPAGDDGKATVLAERSSLQQQLAHQRQSYEARLEAAHLRTKELEESLSTAREALAVARLAGGGGELREEGLETENRSLKLQLEQSRQLIDEQTGLLEKDWVALVQELEGVRQSTVRQSTKPCTQDARSLGAAREGGRLVAPTA
mmetsp:Transcript_89957/g.194602  ORF Transcript_89957/g.194602 Transcript_89957/m.194602 type:complete len:211 (-) Transcript_89957:33-665(-)